MLDHGVLSMVLWIKGDLCSRSVLNIPSETEQSGAEKACFSIVTGIRHTSLRALQIDTNV